MLRPYQRRAIDELYAWLKKKPGNPCLVLPTGAGKSHIIAELCKDALQNWPETRILMLTHVKELIEQNSSKLKQHWPNAPLGIYSASIGRKELDEPITFAGIQSIRSKAKQVGHVDLILVDECHLISHKDEGGYRILIGELQAINPHLRVIGLTASPYRLGHGLITDKPALFDGLIEPVSIEELVGAGYLSILRSKLTAELLDTSQVKKRGGEFIESELQKAVDSEDINNRIVSEIINLAGDRRSWLIFCCGVEHSKHIANCFTERGIAAVSLTGEASKRDRERIINDFKAGRIKALCNVSVLTTGFDYPDIDLIAMLRPTMSPGLYLQMAGRGLRPKSHTDHCLVLDFAGVVATHGPITAIEPPGKSGTGEAKTKACPECKEIISTSTRTCPACGYEYPEPDPLDRDLFLRDDDIWQPRSKSFTMPVSGWHWDVRYSRKSGLRMLCCTYSGDLSDPRITEYYCLLHPGYGATKSMNGLTQLARQAGVELKSFDLDNLAERLNDVAPPEEIDYEKDGAFYRVKIRRFKCNQQN
jgi:DNA repair protein RadD